MSTGTKDGQRDSVRATRPTHLSSVSGYGQVPGHDTDDLTSHVHQLKPTRPISSHHHLQRFQITVARSPKPALMTIGLLGCHHMTRWKRILLGRRREYPSPTSFPFSCWDATLLSGTRTRWYRSFDVWSNWTSGSRRPWWVRLRHRNVGSLLLNLVVAHWVTAADSSIGSSLSFMQ